MKMKMAESLRGEMSASSTKVKCPTMNLNWILKASNDDSDEVFNSLILRLEKKQSQIHFRNQVIFVNHYYLG